MGQALRLMQSMKLQALRLVWSMKYMHKATTITGIEPGTSAHGGNENPCSETKKTKTGLK